MRSTIFDNYLLFYIYYYKISFHIPKSNYYKYIKQFVLNTFRNYSFQSCLSYRVYNVALASPEPIRRNKLCLTENRGIVFSCSMRNERKEQRPSIDRIRGGHRFSFCRGSNLTCSETAGRPALREREMQMASPLLWRSLRRVQRSFICARTRPAARPRRVSKVKRVTFHYWFQQFPRTHCRVH